MVQGGDSANPGTVGIFPKARDAHTLALSVLAKSPLYVSVRRIHACPHRPDPAAGRGERFLTSGGNTHKLRENLQ